jgi:hypothetical protein
VDIITQFLEWADTLSGVLSVISFFVALWAAWGVRRINNAWRNFTRIRELHEELTRTASRISSAAPNIESNQEAMLEYFSAAAAILISLRHSIGGRYLFGSGRRRLILDMEEVRTNLNQYREKQPVEREAARAAYLQISHVALRIQHHIEDRRYWR